jgi:hypothetical protein
VSTVESGERTWLWAIVAVNVTAFIVDRTVGHLGPVVLAFAAATLVAVLASSPQRARLRPVIVGFGTVAVGLVIVELSDAGVGERRRREL